MLPLDQIIQGEIESRRLYLANYETIANIALALPEEIRAIEGILLIGDTHEPNSLYINYGAKSNPNLVKQLRMAGMQQIKSYVDSSGDWVTTGSFSHNGYTFKVKVYYAPQPPNCHIEKYTEVKEVTTYKGICDNTGEEIPN